MSGSYINGIWSNSTDSHWGITDCVISQSVTAGVKLNAGIGARIIDSELFAGWAGGFGVWPTGGFTGDCLVHGNYIRGDTSGFGVFLDSTVMAGAAIVGNRFDTGVFGVATSANVNRFSVNGNIFSPNISSNAVIVSAGTSDHYNIVSNIVGALAITDNGTGTNKTVWGNF